MAVPLQLTMDATRVLNRMHGMPAQIRSSVARELRGELLTLQTRVRQNAGIKARRGASGLFGRLTSFSEEREGHLSAAIGFRKTAGFPYELSQEFGANAGSGAMPIPVSKEAKALSQRGLGPRAMSAELFIFKTSAKAFLAENIPGKVASRMKLHYLLVKSIPPALHFRKTVKDGEVGISDAVVRGFNRGVAAS